MLTGLFSTKRRRSAPVLSPHCLKYTASRSDRMAKYNQLLRIEEELGDEAIYGYTKVYRK